MRTEDATQSTRGMPAATSTLSARTREAIRRGDSRFAWLSRSRAWAIAWPLLAAAVIVGLAWPIASIAPRGGLDGGWAFGLHEAARTRAEFGTEALFTYGPLGFLTEPYLYYDRTGVPAVFWSLALTFGLLLALLVSSRRTLTPVVSVGAIYVLAQLLREAPGTLGELPALIAFVIAIAALTSRVPLPWAWSLAYAVGAFAAIALLGKTSAGVAAALLCAIAVAALPPGGLSSLVRGAIAFALTLAVVWVATGGSLTALSTWLSGAWEITAGFGDAMSQEGIDRPGWELPAFLGMAAALGALVVVRMRGLAHLRAAGVAAATALLVFFLLKRGFTRYDHEHVVFAFAALPIIPLAFSWPRWQRVAALVATGAALGLGFYVTGSGVPALDPGPGVRTAASQVRTLADAGRRAELRQEAAAAVRADALLDPETLALVDGRTVHVGPSDLSVLWAYGLESASPPVFQDYQAYTAELDRRNAELLSGPDAPELVLRHTGEIDVRGIEHQTPRSNLALLCSYRELRATERWQVLERVGDRCGEAAEIVGAEGVQPGQTLQIPTAGPNEIVLARVEHELPTGERLRQAVYKPSAIPWIVLGDGFYVRAVRNVLDGPLLMRVPDVAGHTHGFGTVNNNDTVAFELRASYDITFFRMPITQ